MSKFEFCLLFLLVFIRNGFSSSSSPKTFVGYNIYKGKAAMNIKPIPALFSIMSNGNRVLSKDGGMLIEVAPNSGVREYDWTKKASFLLDPSECGEIICFHDLKLTNEVNFLHDTFMGDPEKAGQLQKRFRITTTPDGKGFFFSLSVKSQLDSTPSTSLSLPVSHAEFTVFKRLLDYSLPVFLGFDQVSPSTSGSWEGGPAPNPPPPPAYKIIE